MTGFTIASLFGADIVNLCVAAIQIEVASKRLSAGIRIVMQMEFAARPMVQEDKTQALARCSRHLMPK